jgi:hypothetical protein
MMPMLFLALPNACQRSVRQGLEKFATDVLQYRLK